MSMISALVPTQLGDKIIAYPVRPVDTNTDFEGTATLQSAQPVIRVYFLSSRKL